MKVKLTTDLYNKLVSLDTEIKDYVKSEKDKCDNKKQREKIVYKQERAIHVLSLLQTIYIKYNQHMAIAQSVIEKECNLTSTHEARFLLNLLEKFGFIQKYGTASALKKIGYRYRVFFDINSQPAFFANYLVNYYGDDNLPEDVELFTELCFENKIYEYLADNIESDRKLAKDFWMKAIYGMESIKTIGDECIRFNKAGLQFAEMFPNVISVVDTIKARFNSYNEFSAWLQRFESKFINSVSDLMYAQGIKNLTVYDEFIVKKSEVQLAKAIIEAYAFKNNLKINLKINK